MLLRLCFFMLNGQLCYRFKADNNIFFPCNLCKGTPSPNNVFNLLGYTCVRLINIKENKYIAFYNIKKNVQVFASIFPTSISCSVSFYLKFLGKTMFVWI